MINYYVQETEEPFDTYQCVADSPVEAARESGFAGIVRVYILEDIGTFQVEFRPTVTRLTGPPRAELVQTKPNPGGLY